MCRRKSFKNYHVLSQLKYEALNFRDKDIAQEKNYNAILKIFFFYIVIYTFLLAIGKCFLFALISKNGYIPSITIIWD